MIDHLRAISLYQKLHAMLVNRQRRVDATKREWRDDNDIENIEFTQTHANRQMRLVSSANVSNDR